MKRIIVLSLITILICCITFCKTTTNKYTEQITDQTIEQSHEVTTYDPATGKPIKTEKDTTKTSNESSQVESEVVPEQPEEATQLNWFQKAIKIIKDKVVQILSIVGIITCIIAFIKFNGMKYVSSLFKFIMKLFKK